MDEREKILHEIRRVARVIEPKPLTIRAFTREGTISHSKVRNHFGTWNEAVAAAGLMPNPSGPSTKRPSLSETDLMEAIRDLWAEKGRRPTESLMNAKGRYSTGPYRKRWGSFSKAVDFFESHFGIPSPNPHSAKAPSSAGNHPSPTPGRPIVLPSTHKPKAVANRPRILYGEPIEFRGLRYAPINEQGVVYLFGMVSRELGFLIESVRTDFPDCEGKRALDREGSKWAHLRIEFEYRSKNFVEHGHDPDGCDLIVCWIHDWKDCPLEVLELKNAIKLLPAR